MRLMSDILVVFSALLVLLNTSSNSNPHIIYILMDDFGWANAEFNNNRQKTPYLNSLLSESINLKSFYVYKFCSPTRSSLLSGRLPYHVNEINDPTCLPKFGIPLGMTTISEKLTSESNYIAHQIGKWHVGFSSLSYTPFGRNFTTSWGYLNGEEDHWTQYWSQKCTTNVSCSGIDLFETTEPAYLQNGTYNGYSYSKRAIQIINNHSDNYKNNPLFMYLATQNTHLPYEVPIEYINKFNSSWYELQRNFSGMANFEDELIKNVTMALKTNGMWNNTLLIISADNGGLIIHNKSEGGGNNSPLRGGKFSDFEGGVNVIAMISGGYLPLNRRGIELNDYIHIADIYSTLCSIVGIDPTDNRAKQKGLPPIDSINMWPYIIAQESISPRNEIFLSSGENGALIVDDYKILFGKQSPACWTTMDYPNGTIPLLTTIKCGNVRNGGCVFDIKDDPTEHEDIANKTENIQLVQQLRERFIELNSTTYSPYRGEPDINCCKQIDKNNGYWGPWITDGDDQLTNK